MPKDPAALFYIDTWLVATKEMKADCRGWYLNLILHQYDKGDLPSDLEELANLADVRVTEYERFKQVFEQVLKYKFEQMPNGRLANAVANAVIRKREIFKDKRELSGKMGYFIKYCRKNLCQDENILKFVQENIDFSTLDTKNEQMLKQVFEQTSKLYINGNGDINNNNTLHNKVKPNSEIFLKNKIEKDGSEFNNTDYPQRENIVDKRLREAREKLARVESAAKESVAM